MGRALDLNKPRTIGATSARRLARGALTEREWAVAILEQSLDEVLAGTPLTGAVLSPSRKWLYWADPFVTTGATGDIWVFVEEFDRWRGLGHIVALRIHHGLVLTRACVLSSAHHLSFPQVHATESGWIATVDTCDPQQSVYAFDRLGEPWRATDFNLPPELVDPAMGRDATGTWFLTGSDRSAASETVWQFSSRSGDPADWQETAVWSHGDLARGGGALDPIRKLRAIQDCSENYGAAVGLAAWPPADDALAPAALRWVTGGDLAGFRGRWQGAHTMNWTADGATVVIDLWGRRPQPLSLAHRYREFRQDPCRAEARSSPEALMAR